MNHPILAEVARLREKCKEIDRLVCDLASGKKRWQMCAPPQPDDTDTLLVEIPRTALPKALDVIEVLDKALAFYAETPFNHRSHPENYSTDKEWDDGCMAREARARAAEIMEGKA